MCTSLIVDFSRVLIFSHEDVESLNEHHRKLSQDIMNYRVLDHFYLNDELLRYLDGIKENIDVYLFSDGELHELPDINSRVSRIFKKVLTVEAIGYKKTDPEAYRHLVKLLSIDPAATIFLDDKPSNVAAAAIIGIKAIRFENNEQALNSLQNLIK